MRVRKLRWACEVGGFVLIGAVAALTIRPFHNALGALLALSTPFAFVLFGRALLDGIRKFVRLLRSLKWWHGLWLLLFVSGLTFRVGEAHSQ